MLPIRPLILFFIAGICCINANGQGYALHGIVSDARYDIPLTDASVQFISCSDSAKKGTYTDSIGHFSATLVPGKYYVYVSYIGYQQYADSVYIINAPVDLDTIRLVPANNTLKEVKITEKSVSQKDDTTEYYAGAFKTNPDADAFDLVRKMPGIDVNGKEVKAQGQNVTKVLIDGKPFFGNDPYASLRNLPADIIDKVQVYNEKSEQEQFTGFSEGNTTKTINIVTKLDKRRGEFGQLSAGYGADGKYLAGGNINQFNNDKRITITAQTNNVNIQNFSDQDLVGLPGGTGGGIMNTKSAGINYSDKWGKKMDVSISYIFNNSDNVQQMQTHRTYLLAADSGQIYADSNMSSSQSYSHRIATQFIYTIDSMNSISFRPDFSFQRSYSNDQLQGYTQQNNILLNQTSNNNLSGLSGGSFYGDLILRHKFHKKGRTFSVNINANNNQNNGDIYLRAQNVFYNNAVSGDTLNQRTTQLQNTWNLSANATYTEPVSKHGLLEVQYNVQYIPGRSAKDAFSYNGAAPQDSLYIPDTALSNTFTSQDISHKIGSSYMMHFSKWQLSAGIYYQLTNIHNHQFFPTEYKLDKTYDNLIPTASLQYKFTATRYLQFTYNTSANPPSVSQLQNVINNTNPLSLISGNPDLQQSYYHNMYLQYMATNLAYSSTFSTSLSGTYVQNYITSNSTIAVENDTLRPGIILLKGSQFTMPVNINGYWVFNGYVSYGMPVALIKSNVNVNMTVGITRIPGIVNNAVNYANNKNGGIGITLSSNFNENVDFTLSSNTSVHADKNSLNTALNNVYVNQSNRAFINIIFWKGFVFNTELSYQYNSGLAVGYNQNYLLWNLSVGKKLFKKHQGDIRLVVYDVLKENNNVQHTVMPTYIEDMLTNTLQRYFMLTFTYKLRKFHS